MDSSKSKKVGKGASATRSNAKAAAQSIDREEASRRIDTHIAECGDWRGGTLAQLRTLIHEVDPKVIEDWKWMGTPVWSHEGMLAHGNVFKKKVKLTIHHGAQLPDPKKLFNASLSANKSRAIDFFEGDKIDVIALKTLLREAMDYNSNHSVQKSKGSRNI